MKSAGKVEPPERQAYELAIHDDALTEWRKLDVSVKQRFKKKLASERLIQPRVPKDALHGLPDCYKIKITTPQFRLAYHVNDAEKLNRPGFHRDQTVKAKTDMAVWLDCWYNSSSASPRGT